MKRGGFVFMLLLLGGHAAVHAGDTNRPRSQIDQLLRQLEGRDPGSRLQAAIALGNMGTNAAVAVPALTDAMNDADSSVRKSAILSLGKLGAFAKPAVRPLLTALEDSHMPRSEVLTALTAIGGSEVFKGLVDKLEHDTGRRRGQVIAALLQVAPSALEDADEKDAQAVVELLVKWRKQSLTPLRRVLESGNSRARCTAAKALGMIGADAKDALPDLRKLLSDKDPDVRLQALQAVNKIERSTMPQSRLKHAS